MLENGTILQTKDGRKIGNAIIISVEEIKIRYRTKDERITTLYRMETDFGNTFKMIRAEIDELFYIGLKTDIDRWRTDRACQRF